MLYYYNNAWLNNIQHNLHFGIQIYETLILTSPSSLGLPALSTLGLLILIS